MSSSVSARIAPAEYRQRIDRLREAAAAEGLDAVLVWAAGGGSLDRHAQLLYLTGYYPSFPCIPDFDPVWRNRGHAALLVTAADSLLVADEPVAPGEDAEVDAAVETRDPVAAITDALDERGLSGRKVGLAGSGALNAEAYQRLVARIASTDLRPADSLVYRLRAIKSPAEQELMRKAARFGTGIVEDVMERVRAGATEADLAAIAAERVSLAGGQVANSFGSATPWRPVPGGRMPPFSEGRRLAEADLYSLDLSGVLGDYFFDVCRSRAVGTAGAAQDRLIELSRSAVNAVVEAIRPGSTAGDAGRAGNRALELGGYSSAGDEFEAFGHGLGLGFEPPYLHPDVDTILEPGMVIAVEKVCVEDGYAAGYERTVLVTEDGTEDLAGVTP